MGNPWNYRYGQDSTKVVRCRDDAQELSSNSIRDLSFGVYGHFAKIYLCQFSNSTLGLPKSPTFIPRWNKLQPIDHLGIKP